MTNILLHLWFTVTWQAFALAGVVFLVTFLFRDRLQPRWRYLLWCVVLLRLALPILPETPWGIWDDNRSHIASRAIVASQHAEPRIVPTPSFDVAEPWMPDEEAGAALVPTADAIVPIESKTDHVFPAEVNLKTVFLLAWLFGLVFLFLKYLWSEYRFYRRCRTWTNIDDPDLLDLFESCRRETGVRRHVRLKAANDVGAGCFGFFHPVIVLSESATSMSRADLRMILVHELVHLRRFDPLALRLSTILCLVHWPNPLAWFVLSRLQRERELACDAAVLHILGQNKQKDYGLAILAFTELFSRHDPLPGLVGIFEKNGTARRIDMIIKYKRSKWPQALLGALLITLVAAVGLTKATEKSREPVENTGTEAAGNFSRQKNEESGSSDRSNRISIRTVDETGTMLGGVEIRVFLPGFKDENRPKTTDENGNMVLRLPDSPKELYVSATAPGRVPQIVYWGSDDMIAGIRIPDTITFTLRKGTTIGGMVVDRDDKPVEGAVLNILSRPNGYGMPGHRKPADSHILAMGDGKPNSFGGLTSCKTDRAGRWILDNVPDGKFYPVEIEIVHPDYVMNDELGRSSFGMQSDALIKKLRKGEYRFVMKRGVSVSGTVRDIEGKPVKDALIVPGGDSFYYYEDRKKAVRTDVEGKYRIDSLRFGFGTITVIAEGFAPDMKKTEFTADMEPIDFDLKSGEMICFRFIDENGKPLPKVRVNTGSNPGSWWREGSNIYNRVRSGEMPDSKIPDSSDEDGIYRWPWAPADKMKFTFHKEGFLMEFSSQENWFIPRAEPYTIVLHHRKIFRGTVIDATTRKPLDRYKVVYGTHINDLPDVENHVWQTPQEQEFSEVGGFEYAPKFRYDIYWLRFTAEGYEPLIAGPYPLEETTPEIKIVLKRSGSDRILSGQVLLPDGTPAAEAEILTAREGESVSITPPNIVAMSGGRSHLIVKTDTEGRFRLGLPTDDKDYRLNIAHSGGFLQVDKSEVKEDSVLRLQPYGRLEIKIPYDSRPDAYNRFALFRTVRFDRDGKPDTDNRRAFDHVIYQGNIPLEGMIVLDHIVPGEYSFQKLARDFMTTYNVTNFYTEIRSGETKRWDLTAPDGVKLIARIRLPDDYKGEFTPEDWGVTRFSLAAMKDEHGQPKMNYLEKIRPSKDDPREGTVEIEHVVPGQCHYNVILSKSVKRNSDTQTFLMPGTTVGIKMESISIPESTGPDSAVFDLGTIQVPGSNPK